MMAQFYLNLWMLDISTYQLDQQQELLCILSQRLSSENREKRL